MASLAAIEDRYWRNLKYYAMPAECNCPMRKEDLFGFVDRVYLGPHGEVVYVQITRTDHMDDRAEKIFKGSTGHGKHRVRHAAIGERLLMGEGDVRILVVGWQKNEKKWKYERTERRITAEELREAILGYKNDRNS